MTENHQPPVNKSPDEVYASDGCLGWVVVTMIALALSVGLLKRCSTPTPTPEQLAAERRAEFGYRVTWRLENGEVRVYEHATNPFRYTDKSFKTDQGIQVVALTGVIEAEKIVPVEKP